MNEVDYFTKMEDMKNNGIQKGVYVETEGSTLQDLEHFQDFLYRNFKTKTATTKCIQPQTNHQFSFMELQKTFEKENIDEINVPYLNFKPIITQTGTCTYNADQVISNYLKHLYTHNEQIIGHTQDFSKLVL